MRRLAVVSAKGTRTVAKQARQRSSLPMSGGSHAVGWDLGAAVGIAHRCTPRAHGVEVAG